MLPVLELKRGKASDGRSDGATNGSEHTTPPHLCGVPSVSLRLLLDVFDRVSDVLSADAHLG